MDEPRALLTQLDDPDRVWTPRELEMIAEGKAAIDAGRFVEWDVVMAWFDAIDRGEDPPVPQSRGG